MVVKLKKMYNIFRWSVLFFLWPVFYKYDDHWLEHDDQCTGHDYTGHHVEETRIKYQKFLESFHLAPKAKLDNSLCVAAAEPRPTPTHTPGVLGVALYASNRVQFLNLISSKPVFC